VVDDEARLRALLEAYLKGRGYHVVTAADGLEALQVAGRVRPDLIVLDIMMPRLDGIGFLKALRRDRDTPVIVLTARVEETDTVLGLELGADDYVTKPFSLRELEARIKAVLRRREPIAAESSAPKILAGGKLVIDSEQHEVRVNGQPIELSLAEFKILELLASRPRRVFSRDEILDHLWGQEKVVVTRTVDVHIRHLRQKLGKLSSLIQSVRGLGYKFEE